MLQSNPPLIILLMYWVNGVYCISFALDNNFGWSYYCCTIWWISGGLFWTQVIHHSLQYTIHHRMAVNTSHCDY